MIPAEVLHFRGHGSDSLGSFIDEQHRQELCAWVASLGEDPRRVLPEFRILWTDDGYTLHLSRKVQREGRDIIDQALNRVWSEPVVIKLGREQCWPQWLYDTRTIDRDRTVTHQRLILPPEDQERPRPDTL